MKIIESEVLFGNFEKKLSLFDWNCKEIDGHNYDDIFSALEFSIKSKKPLMIIANTIKGKGVSFMENITKWHHTVPTSKEVDLAKKELQL